MKAIRHFFLSLLLCATSAISAPAATRTITFPEIANKVTSPSFTLTFTQRAGTRLVDITYNLAVTGPNPTVALGVSSDAGATFAVPVNTVSGAVGAGITAGEAHHTGCRHGLAGNLFSSVQVRVTARDLTLAGAPFVPIAGGDEHFLVSSSFCPQDTQLSKIF